MQDFTVVFGVGAAAAYMIKWAQRSKYFPWFTAEAKRINFYVQVIISGIASLGIGYAWDPAAGTFLITGLSLHSVLAGAWHWFQQFAMQHGWTNLLTFGQYGNGQAQKQDG